MVAFVSAADLTRRRAQRRIPHAEQVRRRRELDAIRLNRPLTDAERMEDDDLARRFAERVRRAQVLEAERALGASR